jgi:hypothetical protein
MADFKHLLLTRFNVRHAPWQEDKRGNPVLTDEWMEHRFGLFDRFCFPSVRAQSNQNFTWLVFFDEGTPERFRRRLDRYREFPPFQPEFIADDRLLEVVRERAVGAPGLVTTRLDNDDAIHRETVARVRARPPLQAVEFVNFLEGYLLAGDRLYRVEHPSNMFISMIETKGSQPFRTVWCAEHKNLGRFGPIHQVTEVPGWITIVHDRNLQNELRAPAKGQRFGIRTGVRKLLQAVGLRDEPPATADSPRQSPTDLTLAEIAEGFGLDPRGA